MPILYWDILFDQLSERKVAKCTNILSRKFSILYDAFEGNREREFIFTRESFLYEYDLFITNVYMLLRSESDLRFSPVTLRYLLARNCTLNKTHASKRKRYMPSMFYKSPVLRKEGAKSQYL